MKIIAIDSSGLVASVAISTEDSIIAEYSINHKKTHSQTLVPMLDEIAKMAELDMAEVDAIAVAAGPGSFTGLRIGSATAKGLAMAIDKPIISVPTVDALAMNAWGTSDIVCPIMDARRGEVYTGFYDFTKAGEAETGSDCMTVVKPSFADKIENVVEELNSLGRNVLFLGDGVPVFRDKICELASVGVRFAPAHMSRQRAGALAVLAADYFRKGMIESAAEHKPNYLRVSQAERERAAAGSEN